MCSFWHGSTFPGVIRYRLGLLAVGPKLGKGNGHCKMPGSARTSVVRAETIESFGATGLAQLN